VSKRNWQELVKRYADGRPICNCGEAYYTPCGHGTDKEGRKRTDMLVCQYGCAANIIAAREEIAGRVIAELPPNQAAAPDAGNAADNNQ